MFDGKTSLLSFFSPALMKELDRIPQAFREDIREIRLRRDAPVCISTAIRHYYGNTVSTASDLEACFLKLCRTAVYAHQDELAQGFVTTDEGIRVGVAGTAVVKNNTIVSYRDISSLCIRFPRVIKGCSAGLLPYVEQENGVQSLLLCGAPSSGKTTILRDLATTLSQTRAVTVVDERRELSFGGLPFCDVLTGTPKTEGMLHAVRTLSPDVIVVDELGDQADWKAVSHCTWRGVSIVASAHIRDECSVKERSHLKALICESGFSFVAFLPPRHAFGQPTCIWKARDLLEDRGSAVGRVCLCGSGNRSDNEIEKRRTAVAGVGDVTSTDARGFTLYDASDPRGSQKCGEAGFDSAWVAG